jgi:flagellar FliL protein
MAAQNPVADAADKSADKAAKPAGKGRGKLFLIIIVSTAVVLLGAGVGAALWLTSGAKHAGARETVKAEEKATPPAGPPLYLPLDPPFVVNFDADQAVRFLQIAVQVMTRDPATVELLKNNDPVVRNDLLLLFGNQKYAQLATREGKEALRTQSLEDLRKVIAQAGGHPERLEAVYFTSFVMQ